MFGASRAPPPEPDSASVASDESVASDDSLPGWPRDLGITYARAPQASLALRGLADLEVLKPILSLHGKVSGVLREWLTERRIAQSEGVPYDPEALLEKFEMVGRTIGWEPRLWPPHLRSQERMAWVRVAWYGLSLYRGTVPQRRPGAIDAVDSSRVRLRSEGMRRARKGHG